MSVAHDDENYAAHAVILLDYVQSLKSDQVLFDFTIKVEDESFQTHRMVLSAYSQYFRAMFSHDTKELQEREVEMKNVRAHAMKECLEFMYTSKFSVNMDTVEDILRLGDMLQLLKVKETCMDYLLSNLNASNCIYILKLLEIFSNESLKGNCTHFLKLHFNDVISSDDFKQLSFEEVKNYIVEYKNEGDSIWNSAVSWIEHDKDDRGSAILEFVKLLMSSGFPSCSVLREMCSKDWFTDSVDARDTVFRNLFCDIGRLENNLSACNCSFLKKLADSYEHVTKEAKNVILSSLKKNLDQVMNSDEFLQYSKDDVSMLLCSKDAEYLTPESEKWNAMIKWLKHNDGNDEIFPNLIRSIDFGLLSLDFIKTVIRNDLLRKKYDDDGEFLLNVIANHRKTQKTFLVVLFSGSGFGSRYLSMRKIDLHTKAWVKLPDSSITPQHLINLNNNVCFLNGRRLFHLSKDNKWLEKASLRHEPSNDAKFVVCAGCLYVVEELSLSKYNSCRNEWDEGLSPCPVNPKHVTASNMHIYAVPLRKSNVVQYDVERNHWCIYCSTPQNTSCGILAIDSVLHTLDDSSVSFYCMLRNKWVVKANRPSAYSQNQFLELNGNMAVIGKVEYNEFFLDIYDPKYNWIRTTFFSAEGSSNLECIISLFDHSTSYFPLFSFAKRARLDHTAATSHT